VEYIYNLDFEKGMSTSLKIGIENMIERSDATFIFLADQPFVPDQVIQTMLEHFRLGTRIIRPQYQGNLGHPILIDKSLYDEFLKVEGDQGGKEIIKKYKSDTRILSFEDSIWGMDIDTVEDYQNGKQYSSKTIY
jgi:molybdenum cofactor cytidylyltransferase